MIRAPLHTYTLDPRLLCLKDCQKCKLNPKDNPAAIQVVPGVGNLDSKMALIFESPAEHEAKTGFPTVGFSYQIIEWLTQRYGFNELTDFFRSNSSLCRAPEDRKPTSGELSQCKKNLDYIFSQMPNLKLVVPVGAISLQQIEGDDSVISLRQGNLGKMTYRSHKGIYPNKDIYTLPIKHPASLAYIENWRGQQKKVSEYIATLALIREVYDQIDSENFEPPYKHHICSTEEECWEWLDFFMNDSSVESIAIDFETAGIRNDWGVVTCLAISHADYFSVLFPLKQYLHSDQVKEVVRRKKGKKNYNHDYVLAPWFREGFEQQFMSKARMLFEEHGQKRPTISAWKADFEVNCFWYNYGIELCPRPDQIPEGEVNYDYVPFDVMAAFRLATNELQSLSLKKVLSWTMPLEAASKDLIHEVLSDPDVEETGFAKMAIKPEMSDDLLKEWGQKYSAWWSECNRLKETSPKKKKGEKTPLLKLPECPFSGGIKELLDRHWCPEIEMGRWECLAKRCLEDSDREKRLIQRWQELMGSGDHKMLKVDLPSDEIFI